MYGQFGLHNMLGPQFLLSWPVVRERDHFLNYRRGTRLEGVSK